MRRLIEVLLDLFDAVKRWRFRRREARRRKMLRRLRQILSNRDRNKSG